MTPTGEDYAISAFCEAVENHLPEDVARTALVNCVDGKTLDENIQAAIKAGEWLDKVING